MIEKQVVLILGAGASKPYGFPLGQELLQQILTLGPGNKSYTRIVQSGFSEQELKSFQEDLRASGRSSIDAFLETNVNYVRIGKAAIAVLIAHSEKTGSLYSADNAGNWYQYLFELIVSDSGINHQSNSRLSIVTYNYDRSIEVFLHNALKRLSFPELTFSPNGVYGGIRILHVHGLLDELQFDPNSSGRGYGSIKSQEELERVIDKISIIHEYEKDKGNYPQIHEILRLSESVVFLGFGFHSLNLQRLNVKAYCPSNAIIYGSTLGLTDSEVKYNVRRHQMSDGIFVGQNAIEFLRNHLEIFHAP